MASTTTGPHGSAATPAARKLVVQTFLSIDGVMEAPGGPDGAPDSAFRHGGWSMACWDEGTGAASAEFLSEPAEVVPGRKTYDFFASYGPNHRGEPGSQLNEATKHVASRTRTRLDWENSRLLMGDVVSAIQDLKRRPGLPLHVVGSANLVQTLLRNDLVDEMELWVFPVVLGTGKRLFHEGAIPTAWKLTRSQASATGVLRQHYQRAGALPSAGMPGT